MSSCGRKKHKATTEERIEIIPFYQTTVTIKDFHLIDTNLVLVEPEEFFNNEQAAEFNKAMWAMVKNPKSKIFTDGYSATPMTYQDLRDRLIICDSVVSFDKDGNQDGPPVWMCDSVSKMWHVNRIRFFESWYLNTKTNLIEKETLGYALWEYVAEKEAYRELFSVFRDDKAIEKAKKYYFSL